LRADAGAFADVFVVGVFIGMLKSGPKGRRQVGHGARRLPSAFELASAQFTANDERSLNHCPHFSERDITRQIFKAAIGRYDDLACHSACNFDPLSRGIGVQN
jgi:hypothetical protein